MKKIVLLLMTSLFCSTLYTQNTPFTQKDYQHLQELESETNLKWVEARKTEALTYFETLKSVPYLVDWYKDYESNLKPNYLAQVPPSAYQIGNYAEGINGKMWRRMNYVDLVSNKASSPKTINIESLNLPIKGDLLYESAISREPDYNDVLIVYKERGKRILHAVAEYSWKDEKVVDGGFQLAPAQTQIHWRDENSVYVNTNLDSPGEFGYKLRLWKRGENIREAKVLFETKFKKAGLILQKIDNHLFVTEQKKAFDEIYYFLKDDKLTKLNLPKDILDMTIVSDQLVVHLKSEWQPKETLFPAGSIISINFDAFLNGNLEFTVVMESTFELVVDQLWNTNDILIVRGLENVQSVLFEWTYKNGTWQSKRIESPSGNLLEVFRVQKQANSYYFRYGDFFNEQLFVRQPNGEIIKYFELTTPINQNDFKVKQWFATSKDGTKVPYYIVHKRGMALDSNNPVIMTGYGGWGRSILPRRRDGFMKWITDGGVYVLANIRGGGEYGPDWHEGGRKEKRQNAYDDFKAVAEDLIKKQITKSGKIGSIGTSNGGLLVANSFIQNPELFGAVIIISGSIDLELAGSGGGRGIGALGERGDPEIPEEWAYMKKISPLHTLESDKNYPPILLLTSRNDDISHCGKSRKFYQRMKDLGYDDVHLIETGGGSHSGTDLPNQKEIELSFFYKNLYPEFQHDSEENASSNRVKTSLIPIDKATSDKMVGRYKVMGDTVTIEKQDGKLFINSPFGRFELGQEKTGEFTFLGAPQQMILKPLDDNFNAFMVNGQIKGEKIDE